VGPNILLHRTIEDALQWTCASRRAIQALEDIVPKKAPRPTRLLLIPHNKCMDHPSLASAQKGAEKFLASTKSIHSEILAHAAALSDQNGATEDAH
jgi:hypothetical protein